MKAAIESRFQMNISRVRNLTDIYRNHLMGSGRGRRDPSKTDVLRSAVVMLHAAMEDLLRSIAYWKLPAASAQTLGKIPLVSIAPALKFSLGDLSSHRGKTVDEVIESSVINPANKTRKYDIKSLYCEHGKNRYQTTL